METECIDCPLYNSSIEKIYENFTSILPQILDQFLSNIDRWTIIFTPRERTIEIALQLNRNRYIVSIERDKGLNQNNLDSILKYFLIKGIIKSYKYRANGNLVKLKAVYNDLLKLDSSYKSMLTRFILDPRNIMLFSSISSSLNKQIVIRKYSVNESENIFIFKLG